MLEALLHSDEPVTLIFRPFDETRDDDHAYLLDVQEPAVARDSVHGAYPALAELGVAVLQNQAYPLAQRVAVLASCLDVVARMASIGQGGLLEPALSSMLDERRVAATVAGFARDARDGNPAVRVCAELYLSCLDSEAYAPVARRVLDNLGFSIVGRTERSRGKLKLADPDRLERRRLQAHGVVADREAFLAKVMAGVYLHSGVPLSAPDPWSSARYFAVCYALVVFDIAGYFDQAPGDQELVDFLVVALRAFTHNSGFYRNTLAWLDGLGYTEARDVVQTVLW